MADRKQFFGDITPNPKLAELLKSAAEKTITEEDLREQRISFAFGNAPVDAKDITKESLEYASTHIRLKK